MKKKDKDSANPLVNEDEDGPNAPIADGKEEMSSQAEIEDEEDNDDDDIDGVNGMPLIPTDPKMVGLSEAECIKKLSCLLSTKIKIMHNHNNQGKQFLNHAGVDFLVLTKHAVEVLHQTVGTITRLVFTYMIKHGKIPLKL